MTTERELQEYRSKIGKIRSKYSSSKQTTKPLKLPNLLVLLIMGLILYQYLKNHNKINPNPSSSLSNSHSPLPVSIHTNNSIDNAITHITIDKIQFQTRTLQYNGIISLSKETTVTLNLTIENLVNTPITLNLDNFNIQDKRGKTYPVNLEKTEEILSKQQAQNPTIVNANHEFSPQTTTPTLLVFTVNSDPHNLILNYDDPSTQKKTSISLEIKQ